MDVDMDDASTKMIRLRNTNRHCDEERPRSQKPTADMQENTYRQENHIRKTSSKQRIRGKDRNDTMKKTIEANACNPGPKTSAHVKPPHTSRVLVASPRLHPFN